MGWERRGKHVYYYERTFEHGGERKRYLGRGEQAQAAGQRAATRAKFRKRDRRAAAQILSLDELLRRFGERVDAEVERCARKSGLAPRRGEWRRVRGAVTEPPAVYPGSEHPSLRNAAPPADGPC